MVIVLDHGQPVTNFISARLCYLCMSILVRGIYAGCNDAARVACGRSIQFPVEWSPLYPDRHHTKHTHKTSSPPSTTRNEYPRKHVRFKHPNPLQPLSAMPSTILVDLSPVVAASAKSGVLPTSGQSTVTTTPPWTNSLCQYEVELDNLHSNSIHAPPGPCPLPGWRPSPHQVSLTTERKAAKELKAKGEEDCRRRPPGHCCCKQTSKAGRSRCFCRSQGSESSSQGRRSPSDSVVGLPPDQEDKGGLGRVYSRSR
jgi:hypothetical protein